MVDLTVDRQWSREFEKISCCGKAKNKLEP